MYLYYCRPQQSCGKGAGACIVSFGGLREWFYSGGMCGFIRGWRGHVWFYLGGHGFLGGHVWFFRGGVCGFFQFFQIQWDTVNERVVRILLECILVVLLFYLECCYRYTFSGWSHCVCYLLYFRIINIKWKQNGTLELCQSLNCRFEWTIQSSSVPFIDLIVATE